jgi:hypothetical protein
VRRTVPRNQDLRFDHRPPDDATGYGAKNVLQSRLRLEAKGIIRLPGMRCTASGVNKAQTMQARGNPYVLDPRPCINGLGVKGDEAYRLWQHNECIRLGIAWLFRPRDAAEQPECPAKQQYEPGQSSSHVARSISYESYESYASDESDGKRTG